MVTIARAVFTGLSSRVILRNLLFLAACGFLLNSNNPLHRLFAAVISTTPPCDQSGVYEPDSPQVYLSSPATCTTLAYCAGNDVYKYAIVTAVALWTCPNTPVTNYAHTQGNIGAGVEGDTSGITLFYGRLVGYSSIVGDCTNGVGQEFLSPNPGGCDPTPPPPPPPSCHTVLTCDPGFAFNFATCTCDPSPTPVIIDVDGSGFQLTDYDGGVKFDLLNTGRRSRSVGPRRAPQMPSSFWTGTATA